MTSGWNLWVWLECIGVVSGCFCKYVYRYHHNITYPYLTCISSFFEAASLLLCSIFKCFFCSCKYYYNHDNLLLNCTIFSLLTRNIQLLSGIAGCVTLIRISMASQPLRFFSCLTLRVTVREMVDLSWSVLHLPDNMCLTRSVLEISIPIRILRLEFNFYINKVNSSK